jgi:hypothetical protein
MKVMKMALKRSLTVANESKGSALSMFKCWFPLQGTDQLDLAAVISEKEDRLAVKRSLLNQGVER